MKRPINRRDIEALSSLKVLMDWVKAQPDGSQRYDKLLSALAYGDWKSVLSNELILLGFDKNLDKVTPKQILDKIKKLKNKKL